MVVNWPEELRRIIDTVEIASPDPEQVYARLHELITRVEQQRGLDGFMVGLDMSY